MPDFAPMDLAVFADDEGNSVRITVLGPVPAWPEGLAAEIVVKTPFVSGRTDLALSDSRLREWAEALGKLDEGEDVAWMRMSRGPSVLIRLAGERDCPEVTVEDESRSMVTIRVPVALPEGWIADQQERLRMLRELLDGIGWGTASRAGDPIDISASAAPASPGEVPGSPRMIVRMAGPADLTALAELRDIDESDLPAYAAWVSAHASTHLPFVAEADGRVIGCAWLFVAERVPGNGSMERWYGDVQSVMVREEHWSRGVGAALMAAILAEARSRGLLHVTVHSGRRAVDFYLRNGFEQHRRLLLWEPGTD